MVLVVDARSVFATVTGQFTINLNASETESADKSTSSTNHRENLLINWNRRYSELIQYRLGLKASHSSTSTNGSDSRTYFYQPSLDVDYDIGFFNVSAGYRISETTSKTQSTKSEIFKDNMYTRMRWEPGWFLPIDINYNLSRQWNPSRTVDRDTDSLIVGTEFNYGVLNFDYTYTRRQTDNKVRGETRLFENHNLSGGYSRQYELIERHLTMRPSYNLRYEVIPGGADVELTNTLSLAVGLSGVDSSPTSGALTNTPSIVDNNNTTGVEIGGGITGLNRNVGFELTIEEENVRRINLTLEPDFLITLADSFDFDVYTSTDGEIWSFVSSSVTFNSLENRFEFDINATAKFFKVVVTENPTASVLATEISAETAPTPVTEDLTTVAHNFQVGGWFAFSRYDRWNYLSSVSITDRDPTGSDFSTLDNSLRLRLNYFEVLPLILRYRNQISTIENSEGVRFETTTNRYTFGIPKEYVTFTTSYQNQLRESDDPAEEDVVNDIYTLGITADPTETMSHTFRISHNTEEVGGEPRRTTDTARLDNALQLYRDLQSNVILGYTSSENHLEGTGNKFYSLDVDMTANLTDRLTGRGDFSLKTSSVQATASNTLSLNLDYDLSNIFRASGRFSFSDAREESSFRQVYELSWIPTERLSTRFTFIHGTVSSAAESTTELTYTTNISWQVSRDINVQLNGTYSDIAGLSSANVFLALNVKI